MPRWAAKVDGNHQEIVAALRKVGWKVLDLSRVGKGCPDLLISRQKRTVLVEVKTLKGKLRKAQEDFFEDWQGEWFVARSVDDLILQLLSLNRSGQGVSQPTGAAGSPGANP